jgi:hypothetical protein
MRGEQDVEQRAVGQDEGQRHLLCRGTLEPAVDLGRGHGASGLLHRGLGAGPGLARAELLEGETGLHQSEGLREVEPGVLAHQPVGLVEPLRLLGVQLSPHPGAHLPFQLALRDAGRHVLARGQRVDGRGRRRRRRSS